MPWHGGGGQKTIVGTEAFLLSCGSQSQTQVIGLSGNHPFAEPSRQPIGPDFYTQWIYLKRTSEIGTFLSYRIN